MHRQINNNDYVGLGNDGTSHNGLLVLPQRRVMMRVQIDMQKNRVRVCVCHAERCETKQGICLAQRWCTCVCVCCACVQVCSRHVGVLVCGVHAYCAKYVQQSKATHTIRRYVNQGTLCVHIPVARTERSYDHILLVGSCTQTNEL